MHRFVGAINFIAQVKRIRVKPNLDNQIVTVIKSGINYKKFKHSGFETDKDNFEVAKMYLQKMILKKKKFWRRTSKQQEQTVETLEDSNFTKSSFLQSKEIENLS